MKLAIEGGHPIRTERLPIARVSVSDEEINEVVTVLRSGQISRGSYPRLFEAELQNALSVPHATVVSSGSAALHAGLLALDLPAGSEVIVPSLTFVATALAPMYVGCVPRFAEVDPISWTLDPEDVRDKITDKTRAIITVDYAGQASSMRTLGEIARESGCRLVVDAAHSIGGVSDGQKIGSQGDLTAFSFFATKSVSAGEGGAITTCSEELAQRLQRIKAHGIQFPPGPRISGMCDVLELGFNFHLSNLNIALGRRQLASLDARVRERKKLSAILTRLIQESDAGNWVECPEVVRDHVFHLYTIRLRTSLLRKSRDEVLRALIAEGIEAGLYYRPVHLFSFFQRQLGSKVGELPVTESLCDEILTLPLYGGMSESDLEEITAALTKVLRSYAR